MTASPWLGVRGEERERRGRSLKREEKIREGKGSLCPHRDPYGSIDLLPHWRRHLCLENHLLYYNFFSTRLFSNWQINIQQQRIYGNKAKSDTINFSVNTVYWSFIREKRREKKMLLLRKRRGLRSRSFSLWRDIWEISRPIEWLKNRRKNIVVPQKEKMEKFN